MKGLTWSRLLNYKGEMMECLIKDMTPLQVMEQLDAYGRLHGDRQTTNDLWSLLTALRGPDDEDFGLKLATTSIIRSAIVPQLAYWAGAKTRTDMTVTEVNRSVYNLAHGRGVGIILNEHLRLHISRAARAIVEGREHEQARIAYVDNV